MEALPSRVDVLSANFLALRVLQPAGQLWRTVFVQGSYDWFSWHGLAPRLERLGRGI